MSYAVKEIYTTLQGEGAQAGRAAVFLRFAGCNLWSGHEVDRAAAVCKFCDTDFVGTDGVGGGRFADAEELVRSVEASWAGRGATPLVVCTGGEPLLQLDAPLIESLQARGFEVAVETNGTQSLPAPVDWLTVSPKAGSELVLHEGDELKLVYCQEGALPEAFRDLAFDHFFLQPMDGSERALHTERAVQYCLTHPQWRLSVQLHKGLGIP